ncbi:MAG TPA: hypothetical protein VD813_11260, partial [Pseudonocardia sp.]|nr:hypothetical protein [Pseudonocardia sp.]
MTGNRLLPRPTRTSWVLVGAASVATAAALGSVTTLGVLAGAFAGRFGAGAGDALFALGQSAALLAGVVTGPAVQRFGPRPLLGAGAALLPAGLLTIAAAD